VSLGDAPDGAICAVPDTREQLLARGVKTPPTSTVRVPARAVSPMFGLDAANKDEHPGRRARRTCLRLSCWRCHAPDKKLAPPGRAVWSSRMPHHPSDHGASRVCRWEEADPDTLARKLSERMFVSARHRGRRNLRSSSSTIFSNRRQHSDANKPDRACGRAHGRSPSSCASRPLPNRASAASFVADTSASRPRENLASGRCPTCTCRVVALELARKREPAMRGCACSTATIVPNTAGSRPHTVRNRQRRHAFLVDTGLWRLPATSHAAPVIHPLLPLIVGCRRRAAGGRRRSGHA